MKTICILVPAYNESEVLPKLFKRLEMLIKNNKKYNFYILIVNDGSTDNTLKVIEKYASKNNNISYLNLSRNFGKEIALLAGLDYANGDATVIIDADLQDPPELIPTLIKWWEEGYDDVYAKRKSRLGESILKIFTSKLYYRILNHVTDVPIQKDTGDFRLLDRRVIEALRQYRESQRNTKSLFSLVGFKKKEVLYDRDPRAAGKTKWNYRKLFNLAIDGITSFTTAPLRIVSIIGVAVSFVAFLYIIYLLLRPLFGVATGDGYSSIMAAILFIGGVQLLSLGVIGEYIARIFNESKQRPLYLIERYHESKYEKKK